MIECKEINSEVIELAARYQGCIFCQTLGIDTLSIAIFKSLASMGVSLFWNIEDVFAYIKNMHRIRHCKTPDELFSFIAEEEKYPHSKKVADLSYRIASRLTDSQDAQSIYVAGFLHDLGKFSMPESLLNAPRWFTPLEKQLIQMHTVYGFLELKRLNLSFNGFPDSAIQQVALYHHERLDGSGYPDRIGGSDIPLRAKITAVADVYDALRSSRPYRSGCDHDLAISYLREKKNQFDHKVVKTLEEVVVHEGEDMRDETQGRCGYSLL